MSLRSERVLPPHPWHLPGARSCGCQCRGQRHVGSRVGLHLSARVNDTLPSCPSARLSQSWHPALCHRRAWSCRSCCWKMCLGPEIKVLGTCAPAQLHVPPESVPQLLPGSRLSLQSMWLWCLRDTSGDGGRAPEATLGCGPGGQVLVAAAHPVPSFLPLCRLSVYSLFLGRYLKYSKHGRHRPSTKERRAAVGGEWVTENGPEGCCAQQRPEPGAAL